MPNEKSPYRSTRLNVEALEARDVPASFGATRGLSLAVGDVISSNPGDEIITGTGPGRQALVRVWAQSGALLTAFNPFGNFKGGVFVAVGNVNSDNTLELICSTAPGTTGEVKIFEFTNGGLQTLADFTPFGPTYSGGVQIAAGNVTGDRAQEIIVGQQRGGSTVKVYGFDSTVSDVFQLRQFQAFNTGYIGGVTLASANTDTTRNTPGNPYNFNYAEIIVGRAAQLPQIKIFDAQLPSVIQRVSYMAFNTNIATNRQGVNVAAGDTDGLRGAEIYVALKNAGTVRFFSGQTGAIIGTIKPYPSNYSKTVNIAIPPDDDDIFDIYNAADLFVIAADGAYEQVPLVFPGQLFSAAGLNGSFLL
jgi:hypothetical protein